MQTSHASTAFRSLPTLVTAGLIAHGMLMDRVAAQESAAPLQAPLAVLPVDSAPFQRLLDVDGDGDLDAVGSRVHENRSSTQIVVWRNDQGVFTVAWQGPFGLGGIGSPPPRSFAIATGNFDGDNLRDFVVCGGRGAEQYLARPNFTFQVNQYVLASSMLRHAVAVGDFDNDGLDDFVVASNGSSGPTNLDLRLATGVTVSRTVTGLMFAQPHVSVVDVTGDARPEILYSERGTSSNVGITAQIVEYAGGQLATPVPLTTTLTYYGTPYLWMGGDLDNDGDGDVVVFHPESGTNGVPRYQIFRRTGPTTLVPEAEAIGGPAEYLADIDGDGDLDGVCCGGGGPYYEWPKLDFASTFEIAQNRGGGDFARAWAFPGAGSESMAGAADVDLDGDVDFVAGRLVFHGRGPWLTNPIPVAGGVGITQTMRPDEVHDSDRDGDPDLFLSGTGGYRNLGDGAFVREIRTLTPPPGRTLHGGYNADVDGDGAHDMVRPQFVGGTFEYMALIRNNGGGHFQYAGPVTAPGLRIGMGVTADHFFSGDADGDGDIDLVANSNPRSGEGYNSQIFWNQTGTFVAGPAFTGPSSGRIEAIADFNGDSVPDLLLSRTGTPVVLRGTGNAATPFVQEWLTMALGLPFEPCALTVADANDDGKLDFVAPTTNHAVTLFVNTTPAGGPIAFQISVLGGISIIAWTSSSSTRPSTVTAADFDGNGTTDLAVGGIPGEPNIGVVLARQTGTGLVPTLADYRIARQAFQNGYAVDADGDGDPDLVGAYTVKSARWFGLAAGSRVQDGVGTPGEAGAAPVLGATGPFRGGHVETLLLRGIPGPTFTMLGISLGTVSLPNVPMPGLTLRVDPASLFTVGLFVTGNGEGRAAASTSFSMPLPHGLQGLPFYVQGFALDAAAAPGVTNSNLLIKQIGN